MTVLRGLGCLFASLLLGFIGLFALLVSILGGGANASTGTVSPGTGLRPGVIPQRYVDLITQAAQTCPTITAPLLAAQIQAESSWNPQAVSSAGARGIAQFMPATWAAVGSDANGNGTSSPMEPGDAIPAQARYMCDQLARIRSAGINGDRINLALAAYNAGFGAVQQYGGIPPYPQTQQYVRKIRDLAATFAQPAPQPRPRPAGDPKPGGWVVPVQGTCTSGFGRRWGSFHEGQDIANALGTPIVAAAGGTVVEAGPASGYGLWVKLRHPGGMVSIYGHVHTTIVTAGQQVKAGQTIATLGNRGQSTGAHLHFQLQRNGNPLDPAAFYRTHSNTTLCG